MLKEFKDFAMRGNVVDMAVGIIIGAAFGAIVNSVVHDIIRLPMGLLPGNVEVSNLLIVRQEGATAGPHDSFALDTTAGTTPWVNIRSPTVITTIAKITAEGTRHRPSAC